MTKRKLSTDKDTSAIQNEWDHVLCPICMDHPHNAVLLRCTSHEKGCKSYICDTSYRHSNCLDRFKELKTDRTTNVASSSIVLNLNSSGNPSNSNLNVTVSTGVTQVDETQNINESNSIQNLNGNLEIQAINFESGWERIGQEEGSLENLSESGLERIGQEEGSLENLSESKSSLTCPMCRGAVVSWEIKEDARKHFNLMGRNCSQDSCSFFGNYQELRHHARKVHPTARPTHVDPLRQQAWRRLEYQREFDDVVSAVHSAMPGAVVFGDYAIDTGDMLSGVTANGTDEVNGPIWSTLFLFQMIESANPDANSLRARSRARAWTRHRNSTGALSDRRRFLWGENLLGLQDDEDDEDDDEEEVGILHDISEGLPQIPRRRRRLTRFRSDNDQS